MPIIELTTTINAPLEICFDLSRSIDLHKISTEQTNEEAIAGTTSGLIGMGESVTWRARHFGIFQKLTTQITEYNRPNCFVDEMISGIFKSFRHEHHFVKTGNTTKMVDSFDYCSPMGFLGRLVDMIYLEKYMTQLLEKRNQIIKEFAESDKWKSVL